MLDGLFCFVVFVVLCGFFFFLLAIRLETRGGEFGKYSNLGSAFPVWGCAEGGHLFHGTAKSLLVFARWGWLAGVLVPGTERCFSQSFDIRLFQSLFEFVLLV